MKAERAVKKQLKALDKPGSLPISKDEKQRLERAAQKNLMFIKDRWKLGEYVARTLNNNGYNQAHLATQLASKDMDTVMKKRAQFPNAQTMTILFNGLAKSSHPKQAVTEAVKHYTRLLKDTRLEANSIHLNAVLNVCGRAGDLDSMFSIVDTINDTTRAPTAYTYTTIINALRFNVMKDIIDLPEEQKNYNLNNAVGRGQAIWEEVVSKWRKGSLRIDEELVCAMGRLILLAPSRVEKRQVLDLVEQTMNIPNLSTIKNASAIETRKKDPDTDEVAKKDGRGLYVEPKANTLALVLQTVSSSRLSSVGIKYWNLLVREYKIQPDLDAWMRLFGMLKQAKASAHATEILAIVPDDCINYRIYRIVMETCMRDNINLNAIKNANRALDSMMERLKIPDAHAMRLYLQVAQISHYHLRSRAGDGDVEGAKRTYGIQIIDALSRLWEPYRKLHDHFFKKAKATSDQDKGVLYNNQREVIALARIMYGSYNKVVQQEMLPEADAEKIRHLGGRINREIHDFFANREEMEPNLRKTKGRGTAEEDMSEYKDDIEGDFFWDTTQAGKQKKDRGSSGRRASRMSRHLDDKKDRYNANWESGRSHDGDRLRRSRNPLERRAPLQW
ncbi:hypothetical protein F66182_4699 [Fusarium sp. NRRL 66182]|nr:hypothetical protein F66182_4699 [Fusarium sp. NRRL 66182]